MMKDVAVPSSLEIEKDKGSKGIKKPDIDLSFKGKSKDLKKQFADKVKSELARTLSKQEIKESTKSGWGPDTIALSTTSIPLR